jgi:hypothetical protein
MKGDSEMAVNLIKIENPQEIEVAVSGPNGANRLYIYTGTAVFSFRGTGSSWKRESISFKVGRVFKQGEFHKGIATASLASIDNYSHAVNAGWAVDSADADWDDESGKTVFTADLAVRDSDGFMTRIGYQVTVLAKV